MRVKRFGQLAVGGCVVALWASAVFGQARIFLQRAGDDPNSVPAEGVTITSTGGETITLDVYVESAPPGSRVKGLSVMLPCDATGGDSGSVGFVPSILVDTERPDYLYFNNRVCRTGPNVGMACSTDADCLDPTPAGDCTLGSYDAGWDDGNCASNPAPPPASGNPWSYATVLTGTAVVVNNLRYIGTSYHYAVSADASGTFVIALSDVFPATQLSDQNDMQIPFTTSGVTINVPTGKCCVGTTCAEEMNGFACNGLGGVLGVGQTCADPCCVGYSNCDDDNPCTFESCQSAGCESLAVRYGDVNGSGGQVNLDDILCINSGFANIANCPNADIFPTCTGDDIIALDDILKVVASFGGFDPCGCN